MIRFSAKVETGPIPFPEKEVAKSGVISPAFGSGRRRRNQLVARLKRRRQYGLPVRGGKKKRKRRNHLGGDLTSGR
jgi:hypothetical protein